MGKLYSFYCGPGKDFSDGIFTKIKSITNERLITQSINFEVSTYDPEYPPENVLPKEASYWRSNGTTNENERFEINFKMNKIKLESIHMITYDVDIVDTYRVYGSSNNNEELIAVFSMEKPSEPKEVQVKITFNVTDWTTRNKISIEIEGTRAGRNDRRFVIHELELIGSFFVPLLTCSRSIYHHYYLYLILMFS